MKKIEPLVTEKYDFENRDKTILFNFWEYRDFDAKNKPNELPSKCYSPGRDFLNKTSMKAINPVVNGENADEYRETSIVMALIGSFELSGH